MDKIEKDRKAICCAWRDLVDACGGNGRAAKLLKIGEPQVTKYGHDHYNEMPRIDHAVILEADCKQPIVTRLMAELIGFTIVEQQDVVPADALVQGFSEVVQDSGAALSTVGHGMADGRFDGKDVKAALPAMRELVESATGMVETLEKMSDGGQVVDFRQSA